MNAHQQARRRTWRSLFLLDSNKLTRIQNILTDRLTRNQVPPSFNCAVTLRNGTADTFQSIPDVLALDNTKRNPISSLTIAMLFYMLAFCYPMNVFLWGDYGEH